MELIEKIDTINNPKGIFSICNEPIKYIFSYPDNSKGNILIRFFDNVNIIHNDKKQDNEKFIGNNTKIIKNAHKGNINTLCFNFTGTKIASASNSGTVIRIYYIKAGYNYKVEYYYDGEQDESKTEEIEATYGDIIESVPDKAKEGYEYKETKGMPLTITEIEENNVIRVYYESQKYEYTVKYYYDGELDESKTYVLEARYGEVIDRYEDKTEEGYEFSRVENIPLTISDNQEENVINVYYVSKTSKIEVKYIDKNTGEELVEGKEIEGKIGTRYDITGEEKEIEGYTLIEKPETLAGVFTEEETEKVFYYAKNTEVKVIYIDPETGEILEEITEKGYVGKEYTSIPKEYKGYILIEKPEEETVIMTETVITIEYHYKKITGGVIEKHIDEDTGEVLYEEYHEGQEGDEYEIIPREFEDYVLDEERLPENSQGEMTEVIIKVIYYYNKKKEESAGVEVKYKDIISEDEIEESIIITGNVGDEYEVETKEIEGYDLVEEKMPENRKGIMTKERIIVEYYYARKAEVIVEYRNKLTNEKILEINPETQGEEDSTEIIEGHIGDKYETERKEFAGYELVEIPENAKGTMEGKETKVIYYYVQKAGEVIVNHIDKKTGEKLAETEEIEGNVGDEYKTEKKEFEGYDVVEIPENAEGRLTEEPIRVTYYYLRKVKVITRYYDKDSKEKLSEDTEIEGHEGEWYETEERVFTEYEYDSRTENYEGTMEIRYDAEGNMITEIIVEYYYKKKAKEEKPTPPNDNTTNENIVEIIDNLNNVEEDKPSNNSNRNNNTNNNANNNTENNSHNNNSNRNNKETNIIVKDGSIVVNRVENSTNTSNNTAQEPANKANGILPRTGNTVEIFLRNILLTVLAITLIRIILLRRLITGVETEEKGQSEDITPRKNVILPNVEANKELQRKMKQKKWLYKHDDDRYD